jgi:hypothetical protein
MSGMQSITNLEAFSLEARVAYRDLAIVSTFPPRCQSHAGRVHAHGAMVHLSLLALYKDMHPASHQPLFPLFLLGSGHNTTREPFQGASSVIVDLHL